MCDRLKHREALCMAELTMVSNKSLVRIQRNGDMNAIHNDMW